jgi:hypothetical protein
VLVVNIGGDADDAVRCSGNPQDEFQHGIRPIDMPINRILSVCPKHLSFRAERMLMLSVGSDVDPQEKWHLTDYLKNKLIWMKYGSRSSGPAPYRLDRVAKGGASSNPSTTGDLTLATRRLNQFTRRLRKIVSKRPASSYPALG